MSGSMGNKIRHNSKAFTTCEQDRAAVKALLFFVLSKYDQPDKDKRLNMRKTNNNNISKVIEEPQADVSAFEEWEYINE